ncbi:NADP-dependent 3-hydroxy acid dehydrogenase YdfG [Saccharothrix carnea]|uniref:NADP-dependent 3-hydroxy acid dehydrogenase YdfG n=1 Tax=Saccharothrix carnea TaxID=1280637 RepID=A0A2P8I2L3_SACCR|nr:SDR family oxidoreductase [Saccharothrix carnea]PSL52701.1 NADP-dependent 3-hydroxy acid dehydrogenase YdfG [Saccharothrix carnea]
MTDLSDQVALVTGAGRGIGRQIALSLAAAGSRVAVLARTGAELEETAALAPPGRVLPVTADMTDERAVGAAVDRVADRFGPVTLLVNNAAVYVPGQPPLWESDFADWWRVFDVNVRGPLVCARAVLPTMVARDIGRVITVGSDSGVLPGPLNPYPLSKNVLVRVTESLTESLAAAGSSVRAFTISPGTVKTALTSSFVARYPDQEWTPVEWSGRLVVDLASGRYDALHGRYLSVFDDLDVLLTRADEVRERELLVQRMRVLEPAPGVAR